MKLPHSFRLTAIAILLLAVTLLWSSCAPEPPRGSWQPQDSGNADDAYFAVNFVNERQGWLIGWNGSAAKETEGWRILQTGNSGLLWEPMPDQVTWGIRWVTFVTPTSGWAITLKRDLLHTTDGGATWHTQRTAGTVQARSEAYQKEEITQPEPLDRLFFVNEKTGWAWGGGQRGPGYFQPGILLRTSDGGQSWQTLGFPFGNNLVALQFADAERGWTCEQKGPCYRSDDGGRSWKQLKTRGDLSVNGLHFSNRDHGWVVSNSGYALRTSDGGATWTYRRTGTAADLRDVFFLNPNRGWIVGNRGTILSTTNAGDDWHKLNANVADDLTRVQFIGPTLGWAVGNNGAVIHYAEQ